MDSLLPRRSGLALVAAFLAMGATSFADLPSPHSSPATPTGTQARNNSKDSGGTDLSSPVTSRNARWRTVYLRPAVNTAETLSADERLYAEHNGQVYTQDGVYIGHLSTPDGTPIRLIPDSDDFQIRSETDDLIGAHSAGNGVDASRTILIYQK